MMTLTTMRPFLLTGTLVLASMEPGLGGEFEFTRYAITQGGLLMVVFVLLWYVAQKHKSELATERRNTEEERRRAAASEQQVAMLMTLVGQTNSTMQRSINASEATEKAIHRLSRAVEKIEDR